MKRLLSYEIPMDAGQGSGTNMIDLTEDTDSDNVAMVEERSVEVERGVQINNANADGRIVIETPRKPIGTQAEAAVSRSRKKIFGRREAGKGKRRTASYSLDQNATNKF